jgi:hypothetical protein
MASHPPSIEEGLKTLGLSDSSLSRLRDFPLVTVLEVMDEIEACGIREINVSEIERRIMERLA